MRLGLLRELIKDEDPNLDLANWLQAKQTSKIEMLSIEESLVALPIIEKVLGKPYTTAIRDYSGHWLGHRRTVWQCSSLSVGVQLTNILIQEGFPASKFKITGANWFTVWTDPELQLRDFKKNKNAETLRILSVRNRDNRLAAEEREREERRRRDRELSAQFARSEEERKAREARRLDDLVKAKMEEEKERKRQELIASQLQESLSSDPLVIHRDLSFD